jgi:uncharacterized membrane protein (UPF0127 family)
MHVFHKVAVLALITTLGCIACSTATTQVPDGPSVTLGGQRFTVEIASTPAEQARGLMERTSMAADHGMLFVFQHDEPRTFWMKDTLIPLDMLFFDADRRLVALRADAQPCKSDPCEVYPSGVPARYVLELNAGVAAKLGARTGDVITFSDVSSGTQ